MLCQENTSKVQSFVEKSFSEAAGHLTVCRNIGRTVESVTEKAGRIFSRAQLVFRAEVCSKVLLSEPWSAGTGEEELYQESGIRGGSTRWSLFAVGSLLPGRNFCANSKIDMEHPAWIFRSWSFPQEETILPNLFGNLRLTPALTVQPQFLLVAQYLIYLLDTD